ncbi:hypothetical protein [Rhodopirellula sallentina]|uniref:Uncharacterized protein n=1 Tax=Rhodopirellula sallentina SM41 TaxID=1263870 RepID=M5U3H7_9BACT|nr:hypothetical protein [Rhodopirellula sallentina]EMI52416.1 hypothetical protein RSSM_06128 [Rhodopirellula sallentina SM41]
MSELSPEMEREIREFVEQGKKLHAIKVYKEHVNSSLLEAKNAIEAMEKEAASKQPESAVVQSQSGCAGMLVLIATTFGVALGAIALLVA